jgi:5,10-methylene-tetrahydrofolate dehydrogenase/methenyl tetrahydrofolate cyclohydrolase
MKSDVTEKDSYPIDFACYSTIKRQHENTAHGRQSERGTRIILTFVEVFLSTQSINIPTTITHQSQSLAVLATLAILFSSSVVRGFVPVFSKQISSNLIQRRMVLATDIDGNAIAAQIRAELKLIVDTFDSSPGLAVILVGSRRDSLTYVNMKKKACVETGLVGFGYTYPTTATEEELLQKIDQLNRSPSVHGILVQLPLPSHLNEDTILEAISPEKDVDGLHPINVAKLVSTATHKGNVRLNWKDLNTIPFPIACTPQGCIELLDRSGVQLQGKRAVVIGRSNLVGMPVAMLLQHRNATVTVVHSQTPTPWHVVSEADVVVAAVGKPGLIKKEWLKPGCVVIDVGINSVDDATTKKGYRLVGDVDYEHAKTVASQITPVPGGVGPMTIAMLLRNTINAYKRSLEQAISKDKQSEHKVSEASKASVDAASEERPSEEGTASGVMDDKACGDDSAAV